jgi:alpha-galactosidase
MFLSVVLIASVAALNNGLGRTPAMGWNSWNLYGCNVNETIVKHMADAIVDTGLRELGYQYVTVDDCWQAGRGIDLKIRTDRSRFPSGMKALGDYIHSKGLKFGIYSSAGVQTCMGRAGSLFYEQEDADTYAEWGVDLLKCNQG